MITFLTLIITFVIKKAKHIFQEMGKPCDYEAYDNNDEISIMMNFKWKIPFYVIIIWLLIYTVHNYFTNGYQNNELRYEVVFGVRMYIF